MLRLQNVFRLHQNYNAKPLVSKFPGFKERFQKAPFSWRISVDGWPYRQKGCVFKFLQRSVDAALEF